MQPLLAIIGILTRASEAKEKTEETQEKEGLELAVTSSQMDNVNTLEITEEKLSDAIKQQFGNNKDFSITDNGDGSFLVSMNDTQRMYYIDETGKIIDQSKMLKISTADELKAFRDDVNSGNTYESWYVYLANDITLDISEEWKPIGYYPMENTEPTDEDNKPFKGIFDGGNHTIEGLNINTTDKVQGLFGLVNGGSIYNVRIGSENNYTVGMASAALVGYLYNGNIYNCINESDINSTGSHTGGIAGFVFENSVVEQCSNYGNIISNGLTVGGIVGQLQQESIISKCINTGTIKATQNVGGITGYSASSIIQECVNTGSISTNTSSCSGGISGLIRNTTINSCYNTGNINSATWWSGGITALVYEVSKIENCYNTGNVTGTQNISGICKAQAESSLEVINCYYLENTVNGANETNVIDGVTVKTSEALKALAPTLGTAFKEAPEGTNDGYPILQWQ